MLVLRIRESVDVGTYQVPPEKVAAAIMAGPFAISTRDGLSLADRIARIAKPAQHHDRN
jgi:hypothetical protein